MIGVIVVLALNTATMFFWTGGLSQRVASLERLVVPLADGTLARLDERTEAILKQLDRIEKRDER
jgi:hypothetical protein